MSFRDTGHLGKYICVFVMSKYALESLGCLVKQSKISQPNCFRLLQNRVYWNVAPLVVRYKTTTLDTADTWEKLTETFVSFLFEFCC